jgi:hypothetical protein
MSRTRIFTLALISVLLVVSGCGGSKQSSSQVATTIQEASRPGALTRAELVTKANSICRRLSARLASTKVTSQEEFARVAPKLSDYEHLAYAELERLVPPASLAHDWQQIVAAGQTLAADTARLGAYAKVNDKISTKKVFLEIQTSHQLLVAFARADGFKDCALVP